MKEIYKKVYDLATTLENAETDDSADSQKFRKQRVESGNERSLGD